MATLREPTDNERRLLAHLAKADEMTTEWLSAVRVTDVDDGGMGSLRLAPDGIDDQARRYGGTAAEFTFVDADGVKVLAALYVDKEGAPFELDMWKVDFGPLIQMPEID